MIQRTLIVSDSAETQRSLATQLGRIGTHTHAVQNCQEAMGAIAVDSYALVMVDLISKDACGVSIARYLRESFPALTIVVVGRDPYDSNSFVAYPVNGGAPQCCTNAGQMPLADVVRMMAAHRTEARATQLDFYLHHGQETHTHHARPNKQHPPDATSPQATALLFGDSLQMKMVRARIADVADADLTVLIRGESGTGKTVAARLIHETSSRRFLGNLSRINCPALPESLLESELFGYEKGAFTGAERQKPGRLELAARGTLFLDEIGAISLAMQAKLLEVLEAKVYFRVGGREPIHMDARIVAATNGHLEELIRQGSFRADLMYRLNQFTIRIPPLRERVSDIPVLTEHFLRIYGRKYDRPNLTIPDDLMTQLERYTWPGNVRELETGIARFCLTGNIDLLTEIPDDGLSAAASEESNSADRLHDVERKTVRDALEKAHWNQRRAAAALGISYSALRRRIAKFGALLEG
ncbi:MAG: sigma-54-dependent Fis family transcriptional regulator [Candidatus Hydrogenedentes bacterium]|nr:sigma-54-dependent Fis family transcriptional regulator [Candidatus Hydrogenedentota bacterium]